MKTKHKNPMERGRLSRFVTTFFCLILAAGCGGGGGGGGSDNNDAGAEWTYMVYMGADNNLSTAGLFDLNEMETVGSDDHVNIVLQAEFSSFYTDFSSIGKTYNGETLRFLIQNDGNTNTIDLEAGQSIGNVDMGAPAALTSFIQWATTTYPAKHYALVIWDHGAGWKKSSLVRGAVQDETSNSFMSLPNLALAVKNAGVHLDLINFDACLMAMYEVAYEFSGLTDYMVFSEEVEPGNGDPYDTILADLKRSPSMTAQSLASTIVENYYNYYSNPDTREEKVTKSAIDMSHLSELHTAMLNFADAIVMDYDTVSGVIAQAQANAQHFEYRANLDLQDFSTRIANNTPSGDLHTAALAVNSAATSMIVGNRAIGSEVNNALGLALFVPSLGQVSADTLYNDIRDYNLLACNQARTTVWSQAVEKIVANSQETLVPGGFAFYVTWDTDADLDLYVWDPDNIYAPWMGQTTPNGYFSADSYEVGESVEYYVANDYVQPGDYDVFIEYYDDGYYYTGANVEFWFYEPDYGDWQMFGPVWLDLSNPYLGDFSDISSLEDLNNYSNYWYTGALSARVIPEEGTARINTGRRTVNFHLRPKKRAPKFTPGLKK